MSERRLLVTGAQYRKLVRLCRPGGSIGRNEMTEILAKYSDNGRSMSPIDETYPSILAAAIARCSCEYNSPDLNADVFPVNVFGILSEDEYVLAQPPKTKAAKKRGFWTVTEIDSWHISTDVAGKNLEAVYLVDLAKYGEENPEEQRTKAIVCWRAGKNGRVACLNRRGGERGFYVCGREAYWSFGCWFLLRKVRQP